MSPVTPLRRFLAVGVVLSTVALAAPAEAAPKPAGRAARSVTLITGDRVTESADGAIAITRGPGRSAMRFVTNRTPTAHHVIPLDAFGLIESGRVDADLFDLTKLRRDGHDDLPLLLESKTGTTIARRAGAAVTRDLSSVGLTALRADHDSRARLWRSAVPAGPAAKALSGGMTRIWLDGRRRLTDETSNAQINAPAAWAKGLTGTDVTVAVLDSGIDPGHPDLAGRINETANFITEPDIDDRAGHGTHVASIIAGTGAASEGRHRGAAPGVRLNIGKVCDAGGWCTDSEIIAGMQWAAPRSRVINMSLGGDDSPGIDPLEKAVGELTARYDSLFVIAAGNSGPSRNPDGTVGSPGSADAALTVAAVDSADRIAGFSNRGPRAGDAGLKPDIAAPGVGILAARAAHSDTEPGPIEGYTEMSGTSMAAPHVAAAAAILTQKHPGWTAARRKEALMASAAGLDGESVLAQGAGRVDMARAVEQEITVDGGSLSFGRQAWPHDDDTPVTKRVTYRNSGAEPVTLTLALTPPRPGLTLGAGTLTVPAGGQASTTLTADTRVPGPDGIQEGRLTATGAGGVEVRVPYALDKEVESYPVNLDFRNRDGSPATDVAVSLDGVDGGASWFEVGTTPTMTFRVPRGTYGLAGYVFRGRDTDTTDDDESTVLGQPALVVDRPMTVRVDAGKAAPVAISVPPRDAAQDLGSVSLRWPSLQSSMDVPSFRQAAVGVVGSRKPVPGFVTTFTGTFSRPGRNSPYLYELFQIVRGTVPTGYRRTVRDADLATIRATYRSGTPGAVGGRSWQGQLGDDPSWYSHSGLIEFDMPFHRTEHVSVAPDLYWATQVAATTPTGSESVDGPRRQYPAGRTTHETWQVG
ncbi:S8 family serine peptidase [Actinoplanes couchii]|nr:S8 family serine peptidase [Actinoplanes couchii]MDR6317117.1 subtilisin family serine protease [Actinoplanes couchii]